VSVTANVEATVDWAIGRLLDALPATIDAINAEITDDPYTLTYAAGVSFGTRSETPFPWIHVLPRASETTMDNGDLVLTNHQIMVVTWVQHWEEEGLARLLVRYQRAVKETLLGTGRVPTEGGYGIQHVRDEYGPVFREEGGTGFVSSAPGIFQIQAQQYI
jgi:hypothetical protein